MNASVQALFALWDVRMALRAVRRGRPADWAGWRFSERRSAEQQSRRAPHFDALLAQTLREMEWKGDLRPMNLHALPGVFYGNTQEDAGEFLQDLLHGDRALVVSELFRMKKVERLVCARGGCGGARAIQGDTEMTCLTVQIPDGAGGAVRTAQEAVDRSRSGEVVEADFRWARPNRCGCRKAKRRGVPRGPL